MFNFIIYVLLIFFISTTVLRVFCNKNSSKVNKLTLEETEKGAIFEQTVASFLEIHKDAKVLKNIIIPNGKGGTTEIDLVVLSTKGFYALECKNYSGYVLGKPDEQNWTICYNHNGYKKNVSFYNPLLQNAGHITALRRMFPKCYFQSIVLFSDTTSIENSLFKRKDVFKFSEFKRYFQESFPKRNNSETQAMVDSLYEFLKSYENKNRDAHIEYVSSFKKAN